MKKRMHFVTQGLLTGFLILLCLHLSFFIVTGVFIAGLEEKTPEISSLMRYRYPGNSGLRDIPDIRFIPFRQIPARLMIGVIFIEDFDFYRHGGIDFDSIRLALSVNRRLGYSAYGGSTLTQQLARTLFLNPGKNYIRKYLEILCALEMELILEKERILELYFNHAEWGRGIYGLVNASLYHFEKVPEMLDDEEILVLITLLANPIDYSAASLTQSRMLSKRYDALAGFFEYLKTTPPVFRSTIREAD